MGRAKWAVPVGAWARAVGGLALVSLASMSCSAPALAIGDPWSYLFSPNWGANAVEVWWLFGGVGALVLGAVWAMSIVLRRPRGARSWEAVVVLALLGLALAAWFVLWLTIVF